MKAKVDGPDRFSTAGHVPKLSDADAPVVETLNRIRFHHAPRGKERREYHDRHVRHSTDRESKEDAECLCILATQEKPGGGTDTQQSYEGEAEEEKISELHGERLEFT